MEKEEDTTRLMLMKKKADAFLVLGEAVHITYENGSWARGIIIDVKPDFFILDEVVIGKLPVFFQEIAKIEKYKPRGVK